MTDTAEPNTPVRSEVRGALSLLTLARPPHNLVEHSLLQGILDGLNEAVESGCRAVLIKSGLRNFSAGADLALFTQDTTDGDQPSGPTVIEFLDAVESTPLPIVCAIHGACLGGGLEIALAADYIIAARSSKIGSVEVTLGLHPIMGGVQRQVERVGLVRAKEMSMLGRRYDAETLESWGLINAVVDDDKLEAAALSIAEELANGPTIANAATKALARVAANEGVKAADDVMGRLQGPVWNSEDLRTGLNSFMKRGPGQTRFAGR
ncbi:enoyl-CoA hydratase/isomerase family protein [uncultured Erythrobacter sp.]|uniref:enoyl-CoA hydratase/isomerase family protein n=1 Tax=uncultured Erythrobacter sp. TaxID=263913 RepID=UPI0026070691|nr:enoyl-CoA hydratase/isomerase family protein [uncultured Erythrobacter sp.]